MTAVRMITDMHGGRYDDRQWPGFGAIFDVPDWEADELITARCAVLADAPEVDRGYSVLKEASVEWDKPKAEETPEPEEEDEPDGLSDEDDDFDRDDYPADSEAVRPATNESKAAWVKWAVEHGSEKEPALAMTKAALIAEYGKR